MFDESPSKQDSLSRTTLMRCNYTILSLLADNQNDWIVLFLTKPCRGRADKMGVTNYRHVITKVKTTFVLKMLNATNVQNSRLIFLTPPKGQFK